MRIVDTHLHLIYPGRLNYPWLSGAPAINREFSIENYLAEAEKLGIEKALHMEVDVAEAHIEAETSFVTSLHPKLVGAIASGRPESPDFPAQLERLMAIKGVRGLRRVLHVVPDDLSTTPLFAQNLKLLAQHDLTFDLCLRADQLPMGRDLVAKVPEVQFVLDHCGVPDVAGKGLDPWRAYIKAMAEMPNVVAKISGVVAYAGADWVVDDLRPFVEHVIESFGWDRVVWGSDHPVVTLTGSLTRWVEATMEIIAGASADEQAKLLHANAERVYRV